MWKCRGIIKDVLFSKITDLSAYNIVKKWNRISIDFEKYKLPMNNLNVCEL